MESDYTGAERRKSKRVSARFAVTFKVETPSEVAASIDKMEIDSLMLDLSEGGMAIVTNCDIPAGAILLNGFTLINTFSGYGSERTKVMDMVCEVRYTIPIGKREHRLGFCFKRISSDYKKAIADFVEASEEVLPYF